MVNPPSRGLSGAALSNKIPKEWSAGWFQSFITTYLQNADIRNATAGPGVSITGNIATPATLSATQLVLPGESVFGNPTSATAAGTSIKASADNQVLQRSDGELLFGPLLLATGTGIGPVFEVAALNPGAFMQATAPAQLGFTNFTAPTDVTAGDIWIGSAAETLSALAVGSNNQVLAVVSGAPAWANLSTIGVTSVLGTANQITVNTVTGVATISIATGYVGQTSITTLGTITSGTWQGTTIATGFLPASQTQLTSAANLATVGTITSGTWNGTTITPAHGGTGVTTTPANGAIPIGNATNYTVTTLTAGAGIGITNGSGSITVAANGIGGVFSDENTAVSLTTANATLANPVSLVAGTYLCLVNIYLSASTSSTMTISSTASAGTLTKATGGEVRVHNASNTVQWDLVNIMASGSFSIFSGTTQTVTGWGMVTLSAAASITLSALVSATATAGTASLVMIRVT